MNVVNKIITKVAQNNPENGNIIVFGSSFKITTQVTSNDEIIVVVNSNYKIQTNVVKNT